MTKELIPHPHREVMIACANGAQIQVMSCGTWEDIKRSGFYINDKYRVKPETVKYRLYLNDFHATGTETGMGVFMVSDEKSEKTAENYQFFIRWLGDWQEVEI